MIYLTIRFSRETQVPLATVTQVPLLQGVGVVGVVVDTGPTVVTLKRKRENDEEQS